MEDNKNSSMKAVTVLTINKALDDRIDAMCKKHNMGRDFFITKALENYCKYLAKKKVTTDKKED